MSERRESERERRIHNLNAVARQAMQEGRSGPDTGESATELISVTVTAATAMDAEACSISAFVLGPEEGLTLVVSAGREALTSSGW